MKRGLLIAAGVPVSEDLLRALASTSDYIIAADGGYDACRAAGVVPQELVGDMDSLSQLPNDDRITVVRLPREKNDTDMVFALRRLLKAGCEDITITCALGGRLDHTFANLCALRGLLGEGKSGRILSDDSVTELFVPGEITLGTQGRYDTFSLFPFEGSCKGVSIRGAKYPLSSYTLQSGYPIGVSNEFLEEEAQVSFTSGVLLVIKTCLITHKN